MRNPFRGSIVALPTPFRDGRIDYDTLEQLVRRHFGVSDGIAVAGTTGEAMSLTDRERRKLILSAIEFACGKLQVLAGVGTAVTAESVELARFASSSGADGLLVVSPPYSRPSRRALAIHFGTIADATAAPVVLYDVPGRTGVGLDIELVQLLRDTHPNIVALKEATGDWERMRHFIANCGLPVLCGDDALLLAALEAGAIGSINVVGNLLPELVRELTRLVLGDDDQEPNRNAAQEIARSLTPLLADLNLDVNPVPVKCALAMLGFGNGELRAPLLPLETADEERLAQTLRVHSWNT